MKILSICVVLCFITYLAFAEDTTKGGYIACKTEEQLDQMAKAAEAGDAGDMASLLEKDCFTTNPGIQITVLDRSKADKVRIRVDTGSGAVELWTYAENIDQ